ncbi:MAG: hypothetical protein FK733_04060 [Asgard group archaeon]|nr:hypothetical protein [Asgard group archaeon]
MNRKLNYFKMEVYVDSIASLVFLLAIFIKSILNIATLNPSAISLYFWIIVFLLFLQILNITLYHFNKLQVFQLILSVLSLALLIILCTFSLAAATKFNAPYIIMFLVLIILKSLRITNIIISIVKKKNNNDTLMKQLSKKKIIIVVSIIFMILLPTILSPILIYQTQISSKKINLDNNQEIQLSFYATIDSYNYLTNSTILNLLNGSSHPNNVKPVEILLLIRESYLLDVNLSQRLAEIIANCTSSNIKVWTWFIYTLENGYYPSWEDSEHLINFKLLFDNWVSLHSLTIDGILFDNELDHEFYDFSLSNPFKTVKRLLDRRNLARNNWSLVLDNYESVISSWRTQGYEIALVGSDLALIDILDYDLDIQQTLGIVNFPVYYWDRVSIMMYRYCLSHLIPLSQHYLFTLAQLHKAMFDNLAVAALGCMGYGCYQELDKILEDIALMKYLEYDTVELFELGAFYLNFGFDGLVNVLNSTRSEWMYQEFNVQKNSQDSMYFLGIALADVLLDFF